MITADYLVMGSGIAGLSVALNIVEREPSASVLILTKSEIRESNTRYAQGGIAVVTDHSADSFDAHIEDTLRAGDGLCDRTVVEQVVREGPARLSELIQRGARFDEDIQGSLHLGREGGHTRSRIIHHADATGFEIERALINQVLHSPSIRILSHHFTVDLILNGDGEMRTCRGVRALDTRTGKRRTVLARATVLATGGAGQVFRCTTNPVIATGDGMAMAYRAGAVMRDMEFIQFHPTAFYMPEENPSFLISEAVRGAGAVLRTPDGREFMSDYDPRGALASRDIVTRAIGRELSRGDLPFVYLDARMIPSDEFQRHFPTIREKCREHGIQVEKDMIPVAPAAHYFCGGVETDLNGQTSINGLYACGECSRTGLHGANRLASNSLLEAIVMAHRCAEDILRYTPVNGPSGQDIGDAQMEMGPAVSPNVVSGCREKLRNLMSDQVGIVRTDAGLKSASKQIAALRAETSSWLSGSSPSTDVLELRNLLDVAGLIVTQAMRQRENRGVHFNSDLSRSGRECLAPMAV